jgi:hypothetical protein
VNIRSSEEEIPMFRIKHLIPTAAVVIASAGVLAPAALAQPDGLYPNANGNTRVVRIVDYVNPPDMRLGAWVHDTPLANPVEPKVAVAVTGRTIPTSGGVDWTLPVMAAVALGLIIMIAGDQILVRRRGQLAT